MSKCAGQVRRLHGQKTLKPSTSIVLGSICVAPVPFTDTSPCVGTNVAATGRVDNLAFAKTILARGDFVFELLDVFVEGVVEH
jgi:hypothetical protein